MLDENNEAIACQCREGVLRRSRQRGLLSVIPENHAGLDLSSSGVVTKDGRVLEFERPVQRAVGEYVASLGEQLTDGRGLWFAGDVGAGKTTLAMVVSKSAIAAGYSVAIYSVPMLLASIRNTYNAGSEDSYLQFIKKLTQVDLLHLDDVGAEQQSPWVLEQLYAIVNERHELNRSIVMTTNLTVDQVGEQIGKRTRSRLTGMCQIIDVNGRDHRQSTRVNDALTG